MVTLRQLRYFHVLSQHLHFGRAANALNISQPPLSVSLRELESRLGVSLMDRNNKSACLTPAGVVFAAHVSRILGQVDAAEEAARLTADGAIGKIAVAFVPTMLFGGLPKLLKSFQVSHPNIDLHLQEMNSTEQIEGLTHHCIDVGFIHASPCPTDVDFLPLEEEHFVCCVPRGHSLAEREHVAIRELAEEKILAFSRDACAYYHDRITAILRSADLVPHTQFKIRYWFTLVALVGENFGVAIVPSCLKRSNLGDVVYLDLIEDTAPHNVNMIWRKDMLSNPSKAFVRHVRAQLQDSNLFESGQEVET
jgi:DNA-binding transcriptional LysR family regulator